MLSQLILMRIYILYPICKINKISFFWISILRRVKWLSFLSEVCWNSIIWISECGCQLTFWLGERKALHWLESFSKIDFTVFGCVLFTRDKLSKIQDEKRDELPRCKGEKKKMKTNCKNFYIRGLLISQGWAQYWHESSKMC